VAGGLTVASLWACSVIVGRQATARGNGDVPYGESVALLLAVGLAGPSALMAMVAAFGPLTRRPSRGLLRAVLGLALAGLMALTTVIWLLFMALEVVSVSLTRDRRDAELSLARMQDGVTAIDGVTGVRDPLQVGADLASGYNLHLTADVDPALSRTDRLAVLDRISQVLAEQQTTHRRTLVLARIGDVSLGVSANADQNPYRLSIADDVLASGPARSVLVTWPSQGDDLVDDTSRDVWVVVGAVTGDPAELAEAAMRTAHSRASNARATAVIDPTGDPPAGIYPTWADDESLQEGRRQVSLAPDDSGATTALTATLDTDPAVVGYDVELPRISIAAVDATAAAELTQRLGSHYEPHDLHVSYPGAR
jgi:hypothetical protein